MDRKLWAQLKEKENWLKPTQNQIHQKIKLKLTSSFDEGQQM